MEQYFKTRGEWRKWLEENHSVVHGVWPYTNFNNFPPSSRRLYLLWLNNAKREETRAGDPSLALGMTMPLRSTGGQKWRFAGELLT